GRRGAGSFGRAGRGPRGPGAPRRLRARSRSMQRRVVVRTRNPSGEDTPPASWNRTKASWTASSASTTVPSIRYATDIIRCRSRDSISGSMNIGATSVKPPRPRAHATHDAPCRYGPSYAACHPSPPGFSRTPGRGGGAPLLARAERHIDRCRLLPVDLLGHTLSTFTSPYQGR